MTDAAHRDRRPQPGQCAEPARPFRRRSSTRLTDDIVAALKTVYDPEIPVDIYELGLIYKVDIDDDRNVAIDMTLTAPGCPVAGEMPGWVENAVSAVPGVQGLHGHHRLRSAVGPQPHVRRGPRRPEHVVRSNAMASANPRPTPQVMTLDRRRRRARARDHGQGREARRGPARRRQERRLRRAWNTPWNGPRIRSPSTRWSRTRASRS